MKVRKRTWARGRSAWIVDYNDEAGRHIRTFRYKREADVFFIYLSSRMLKHQINRWHHDLAQITGAMTYRMVKHAASRSEMLAWAAELKRIAQELEDAASAS